MTHEGRRTKVVFAVVLAVALLAIPLGAQKVMSAAKGRDAVFASVFNGFSDIELTARSSAANTDVSGRFRLTNTSADPNQVFEGDVLCLQIIGGDPAIFSAAGVITRAPAGSTARGFVAFGSDSGKFSTNPDTFSFGLSSIPQTVCQPPSPGQPVADGEVVIQNTLP